MKTDFDPDDPKFREKLYDHNVIQQMKDFCNYFIKNSEHWLTVRYHHDDDMFNANDVPYTIEDHIQTLAIVRQFEHELIMLQCRCPQCRELGYMSEWNKDTRGYDRWCDFCGYEEFEPEI
jgi:hypothetical protein